MAYTARSPHNGIQYVGLAGATRECERAIMRLVQCRETIARARILTSSSKHCILLTVGVGDLVAVRSGFTSGYGGTGPHAFSYVLQLLDFHGADLEEYDVAGDVLDRIDNARLTIGDIATLDRMRPVRPSRWPGYVAGEHWQQANDGTLWRAFLPVIPLAIVDARLGDLAKSFWESPDERLLTGYRRLEDIVRKRTGLTDAGSRLFSKAFAGATSRLFWKALEEGEQNGRANLFIGVYMAHRNPRAHRETLHAGKAQLAEFLLLNHLFVLEAQAQKRRGRAKSHHET